MSSTNHSSPFRTHAPRALFALLFVAACSAPAGEDDNVSLVASDAVMSQIGNVTFKTVGKGTFLGAQNNGGSTVNATATTARTWETFTILDANGGALVSGDQIFIKAGNGQYLQAVNGGGGALNAASNNQLGWETFRIVKASGGGAIASGDQIGLQTSGGSWVSAQNAGGGQVFAYGGAYGPWEQLVVTVGSTSVPDAGAPDTNPPPPPPPPSGDTKVVAYLPNYSGSFGDWSRRIDFTKMTHLNLAFALATGNNDWNMGASDGDVRAIVDAAHAHGVKVLPSLGGGGGDQSVIARYRDANNIEPLVANLERFITKFDFDGADVDIEDGNNLGANYSTFIDKIVGRLRPKGKLVTAAVAQYLQVRMSDATLHQFDFVNVMIYTNYEDSVNQLKWFNESKNVPRAKLTLGAAFFGTDSNWQEYAYKDIMRADGNAWSKDVATVNGKTVHYTGVDSMKRLCDLSKQYGGIMFWELSEDTTDSHSLWKAIQSKL